MPPAVDLVHAPFCIWTLEYFEIAGARCTCSLEIADSEKLSFELGRFCEATTHVQVVFSGMLNLSKVFGESTYGPRNLAPSLSNTRCPLAWNR